MTTTATLMVSTDSSLQISPPSCLPPRAVNMVAPKPAPRKIYGQQQQPLRVLDSSCESSQSVQPSKLLDHFSNQTARAFRFPFLKSTYEFKPLMGNLHNNHHHHFPLESIHQLGKHNSRVKSLVDQQHQNLLRQQQQASEETNESTSDDDTEDSSDQRHEKPKPGKLDLSQFNNLSTAIGKLSVQAPASGIAHKDTQQSKSFSPPQQEASAHESGFFKGRVKKSSAKSKAPTAKPLAATIKQQQESRLNQQSSKQLKQQEPRESGSGSSDQLASFKSTVPASPTSSRDRKQSDEGPPKPAPRSVSTTATTSATTTSTPSASATNTTISLGGSKLARQTASLTVSSGAGSPAFTSSAGVGKRVGNSRQNHGRAVAPPQLPLGCSVLTAGRKFDDNSVASSAGDISGLGQQQADDSSHVKAATSSVPDDGSAIDFSQSPITSRLLAKQHSKEYKGRYIDPDSPQHLEKSDILNNPPHPRIVSELNSPYESDNDHQPVSSALRVQKITKGKSFGLDATRVGLLGGQFTNSSIDSSELINSRAAAIRQLNEILASEQPPFGRLGGPQHPIRSSSVDQQVADQQQSSTSKKSEKDSKKEKKKSRDDEKLEKRRLKEEERQRRQEKKLASKKSKSSSTTSGGSLCDDGVPLFVRRCIEFIEFEGLDAEGIYRVPGNRAHVDAFVQKFKDDPDMSIAGSDIPVNAVATALKDFLSKKWGPIIPLNLMNELTELSNIPDKERRVEAIRELVNKLTIPNYKLLKYLFSHFVKVSHNHSLNSMDSKNLAICWWPTLLPLHFSDMVMFEQMRPHLEESIQSMIDQYDFIFENEEPGATQG